MGLTTVQRYCAACDRRVKVVRQECGGDKESLRPVVVDVVDVSTLSFMP